MAGPCDYPLRLSSCRRSDDAVEYIGLATITGPDSTPLTLFRVIAAPGSRLYLRTATHILLADIADKRNRVR
jgi:hypothetical protein